MRIISKMAFAAAVAAIAFLGLTGAATADSGSVTPGGNITATSSGRTTFVAGSLDFLECNVELRGSLTSGVVAKTVGARLGAITGTTIDSCNLGISATPLNLPWNAEYVSIRGTLPSAVTGLTFRINTAQFQVNNIPLVGNCLYSGLAQAEIAASGSNPYTSGNVTSLRTSLSRVSGGFLCPGTGYLQGSFTLSPTQTITRL